MQLGGGETLRGFSVSANPESQRLDTTKPVVLFLSGSAGQDVGDPATSEDQGADLAAHFAKDRGCNFVGLNYRGFGQSSDIKLSERSITQDGFAMLNHLLDQRFRTDDIIVHGYSLGASVAAQIQRRVEASGHELRGVVYDRPMSSATGAAKAHVGEMVRQQFERTRAERLNGGVEAWAEQTQRIAEMASDISHARYNYDIPRGFAQYGNTRPNANPFETVASEYPQHDQGVRAWLGDGLDLTGRLLEAHERAVDGKPPLSSSEIDRLKRDVAGFCEAAARQPPLDKPLEPLFGDDAGLMDVDAAADEIRARTFAPDRGQ